MGVKEMLGQLNNLNILDTDYHKQLEQLNRIKEMFNKKTNKNNTIKKSFGKISPFFLNKYSHLL